MDKSQAINAFWNSFIWPAYHEYSVPDDARFPYITYSEVTDSLGNAVSLSASLWDRSTSWSHITLKSDEIAKAIAEYGHFVIELDNGYLWLVKGNPFAQRMNDPNDDRIKRIYLNVLGEFLTAY